MSSGKFGYESYQSKQVEAVCGIIRRMRAAEQPGIKLATLNIQGEKHLEEVMYFLKTEGPDIACLQEVGDTSVQPLSKVNNTIATFAPQVLTPGGIWEDAPSAKRAGLLILTRDILSEINTYVYRRNARGGLPTFDETPYRDNRLLLMGRFKGEGISVRIATTHFTYSPDGEPNFQQREDLGKILNFLSKKREIVLTGDFNAPRGGEIFNTLAGCLRDNLPPEITSTLDPRLHKAGALELVVDGIFSSGGYSVSSVRTVEGVSDHKAIVGVVRINQQ